MKNEHAQAIFWEKIEAIDLRVSDLTTKEL